MDIALEVADQMTQAEALTNAQMAVLAEVDDTPDLYVQDEEHVSDPVTETVH